MTRPVLIIEDDADISESLKYNFQREGLAAVTAPTGEAGLTAALNERDPPRLIILDLMMPEIIGYGVCEIVRKSPGGRDLPILILSACSNEDVRRVGLECGANEFLSKTISSRELIRKINHLLHIDGVAA